MDNSNSNNNSVNSVTPQTNNDHLANNINNNNEYTLSAMYGSESGTLNTNNQQQNTNTIIQSNINNIAQPTIENINNNDSSSQNNSLGNNTFISDSNTSALIDNQINVTNVSTQNQMMSSNSKPIKDEELLDAFIGDNVEKIKNNPFNFAAFFFTNLYMFYRKMFLYGILVFVINIIVLNIIKNSIVTLLFNVVIGLFVNKIYLYYARKKVAKIKIENPQKSNTGLKTTCVLKGGTSMGKVLLGIITEIVLTVLIVTIILGGSIASIFGNIFTGLFSMSQETNSTYDGILVYDDSIKTKDEFTISIPNKFEMQSEGSSYDYQFSSNAGVFDDCHFSLGVVKGYNRADNLINQMATYHRDSNPTEVAKVTINNIDWYYFSYIDSFGTSYFYGTTKNNKAFLFQYDIQQSASSDCPVYREQILNSIKSK